MANVQATIYWNSNAPSPTKGQVWPYTLTSSSSTSTVTFSSASNLPSTKGTYAWFDILDVVLPAGYDLDPAALPRSSPTYSW